jgi:presequence protease
MNTYDFALIEKRKVLELNCTCYLYRHKVTNTEFLSIEIDDENKVFGISFKTLPEDSNGVAHIIEHTVLAGSEKYPVKEPFIELNKGSLNTFVNAFTFADKTVYPVASINTQDFYNLIDVYMDAVLHPLLPEHILEQEGWHLELEDPKEPLIYKGVVFNEMKGALSNPLSSLNTEAQKAIFPDTLYKFNSGGDPQDIPSLTYKKFKDFYNKYYHPSNGMVFWYGDDDLELRLKKMSEFFAGYVSQPAVTPIPIQDKFDQPKNIVGTYPAGEDETKSMVMVNWLLPENTNQYNTLCLDILSHILLGSQASPLRKALIDSGYGEGMVGGGLADHLKQMFFSTGMKGVSPDDTGKVEKLINDTLATLIVDGIEEEMIASSMNTLEFRLKEQNTGSYPRGLIIMLAGLSTWLYGQNPIDGIEYQKALDEIKQKQFEPGFFEKLITHHLIENKHRVTVVMRPDAKMIETKEKIEAEKLASIKEAMSEAEIDTVITKTKNLLEIQETPDDPKDLEKIPSLALSDLNKQNTLIPREIGDYKGAKIIRHDLFTNGIVYLNLGFDLHAIPQENIPYLGLFANSLVRLGTKKRNDVQLSQWIGRETGGVGASVTVQSHRVSDESSAWLIVRGKSTVDKVGELTKIFEEVINSALFENKDRFRQIVLEAKAGMESSLVSSGHAYVNRRLESKFNQSGWISEHLFGVSQFSFLKKLLEEIDSDWDSVESRLKEIQEFLFSQDNLVLDITSTNQEYDVVQNQLHWLIDTMPEVNPEKQTWNFIPDGNDEGLIAPMQVNYVGKGANIFEAGYSLNGSISVIQNYVRTTYLWDKIRIQGGAYGAFMSFSPASGTMNLLSYRDPNLMETINAYDGMGKFLKDLSISDNELKKSIIGSIGQMDHYQLPDAKGYTSLARYLTGYTDEIRQTYRDQLLTTSAKDFNKFAEAMDAVKENGRVVVFGSHETILGVNEHSPNWLQPIKVL